MRAKAVTVAEQYRLITECRASGMTDYQWCVEHNIKPGTFYNWVKRLRQSGDVDIPAPAGNKEPARQDIVEIHLGQPSAAMPASGMLSDAFTGTSPVSSPRCWSCPWQAQHSGFRGGLTLPSWNRYFLY